MSTDRTIFVFPDVYPYGPFEHCAGVELTYIAERFEKVVVIPRRRGPDPSMREVPENVEVWEPFFPSDDRKTMLAQGLFNGAPFVWPKGKGGARKKMEAVVMLRRVLSHPHRRKIEAADPSRTLLYFYWGAGTGYSVPFLKTKAPIVVRMHGHDLYEEPPVNPGFIAYRERLMKRADWVTPVSTYGQEYLKKKYGALNENIRCSRLGVWDPGLSKASEDGVLRIVTCSRIITIKRLPMIAEALKQVSMPVHWTHIGDGPVRAELEAAAKGLETLKITGDFTNDQVYEFFKKEPVDLFLNVSETEGVPLSIMEALGAGVPVIATDVGGTAELVNDSMGKLLPAELTAADLTQAVETFAGSDRNAFRQAARKRWEEMASAETNYRAFAKSLEEMLG